jgi:hypothetical protein
MLPLLLILILGACSASTTTSECDFCVAVLDVAQRIANSTNVTTIVGSLDKACARTFPNNKTLGYKACVVLAKGFAVEFEKVRHTSVGYAANFSNTVWKLPDIVTTGSGYPNNVICAMLGGGCVLPCCAASAPFTPEQVYITFGPSSSFVASWITLHPVQSPTVQWGVSGDALNQFASAVTSTYTAGGWRGTIYRSSAFGVNETVSQIFYRVGSVSGGWSNVSSFFVPRDNQYPQTVAMIGDMGVGESAQGTIAQLQSIATTRGADWVFHVGDIA